MTQHNYVPTPEQIKEECAKIREGWDERKWADQEKRKDWYAPVMKPPKLDK